MDFDILSQIIHHGPQHQLYSSFIATDINECEFENGGCAQTCINTQGSFECACDIGYTIAANISECDGKWSSPSLPPPTSQKLSLQFFKNDMS
jgi:hypothetical protein